MIEIKSTLLKKNHKYIAKTLSSGVDIVFDYVVIRYKGNGTFICLKVISRDNESEMVWIEGDDTFHILVEDSFYEYNEENLRKLMAELL